MHGSRVHISLSFFPILPQLPTPHIKGFMAPIDETDPPVLQRFESKDGQPLASLPTTVCAETGDRYILWSDTQLAFEDVDHLEYYLGSRGLFMVNKDDEL